MAKYTKVHQATNWKKYRNTNLNNQLKRYGEICQSITGDELEEIQKY